MNTWIQFKAILKNYLLTIYSDKIVEDSVDMCVHILYVEV